MVVVDGDERKLLSPIKSEKLFLLRGTQKIKSEKVFSPTQPYLELLLQQTLILILLLFSNNDDNAAPFISLQPVRAPDCPFK